MDGCSEVHFYFIVNYSKDLMIDFNLTIIIIESKINNDHKAI